MQIRSHRLEVWLIAIALLAVTAACGISYWNIVADRELTRATGIKVADTLAASLEEHVNETFRDAGNAAYSAAVLIENAGGIASFSAARLHQELNRELNDTTSIARLIVADRAGRVIASSAEDTLPVISIALTENLDWHLAHPAERVMRIGVSRASPIDGRFAIPYSRAIFDRRGAAAGVVIAEIDINYLRGFHETLTAIYPASITVFNRNGIVLMRLPYNEKLIGMPISRPERLEEIFKGSGHIELTSVIDGIARYFSYRPSKFHPLAVGVGLEREHIMAPWVARSVQRALVVGCGSIIFLALVALLVVYLRRLQRSEEMLRGSEARLRSLVDHLPDEVYTLDVEGRFMLVNPAWLATRGFASSEQVIGKTVFDVFDRELATRVDAENRRIVETGACLSDQSRQFVNADGTRRYVSVNKVLMRDAGGGALGVLGINRDVTERRNAIDRINYERNLLHSIIDTAPDIIVVKDRECRYVIMNQTALELFGMKNHDEAVGKTAHDFFPPDVAREYEAEDRAVMDSGRPLIDYQRQAKYEGAGGRWMSIYKFPRLDLDGRVDGVISISRDITRTQNVIEEVRTLNAQLEDRVRMRTQELQEAYKELEAFSYSVSHDLRAPLRSISGFGNFLLKENYEQLDANGRGRLQRVLEASERMGRLIDDLLLLARVSRQAMASHNVRLHSLAAEAVGVLREASPQRQVEVVVAPDLTVKADGGLMRVVLDNLLGNAWKFTARRDDARIEVGADQRDGGRVYYVRDNGAGFDMNYAGKLFTPFQRLHTQQQFEGTGIGLATVKRIIERHQGRIWIESADGRGTTVYFTVGATAHARAAGPIDGAFKESPHDHAK